MDPTKSLNDPMNRADLGRTMQGLRTYMAERAMSVPLAARMAVRLLTSYEANEYASITKLCDEYEAKGLDVLPDTDVPIKMFRDWLELRRMTLRVIVDRLQMIA